MGLGSEQTERGLAAQVTRLVDGFGRLVTQHISLARVELTEDARTLGVALARIALFLPLVLTGWALLCAALALLLGPWMGLWGALALVGTLNLGVGVWGVVQGAARLKTFQAMSHTQQELGRSAATLAAAAPGAGAARNVLKEPLDGP